MIKPIMIHATQKIGSVQYNAAIALTDAVRGTSPDKLYHELSLEFLKSRHWLRKLTNI